MFRGRMAKWLLQALVAAVLLNLVNRSSPWRWLLFIFFFAPAAGEAICVAISRVAWIPVTVPIWLQGHFATTVAVAAAASVFLARVSSGFARYSAYAIIGLCAYLILIDLVLIFHASRLVYQLRQGFEGRSSKKPSYIFGAAFHMGGSAWQYLRRIFVRVEWALWRFSRKVDLTAGARDDIKKYTRFMQEEGQELQKQKLHGFRLFVTAVSKAFAVTGMGFRHVLSEMLRGREMTVFLTPSDFHGHKPDFVDYAMARSDACLAVVSPFLLDFLFGRASGPLKKLENVGEIPVPVRSFLRRSADELDTEKLRAIRALHFCSGPSILLLPGGSRHPSEPKAQRGYESVVMFGRASARPAVSEITRVLAATCIPMRYLDRALTASCARAIGDISDRGLAPLADAYLRFRLSSSEVERFLCLFDCFEVLIKYSVFLFVDGNLSALTIQHKVPPLGKWKDWLIGYVNKSSAPPGSTSRDPLSDQLRTAWRGDLSEAVRQLRSGVDRFGIHVDRLAQDKSWYEWMWWLNDLRNVTKGHGGMDERVAASLLPLFHAALLDLIAVLRPLSLDSHLVRICEDGTEVVLKGWLRGARRSSTLQAKTITRSMTVNEELRTDPRTKDHALHGCVVISLNSVLTWHSRREQDMYIDYLSGNIVSVGAKPRAGA